MLVLWGAVASGKFTACMKMKSNVILLRFISKRRNSKEIALILHRTVLLIQQSKLNKPISVRQNKEGGTR